MCTPRYFLVLFWMLCACYGCMEAKKSKDHEMAETAIVSQTSEPVRSNHPTQMTENNPYFHATGSTPQWSLNISQTGIELTTKQDTIYTPHVQPDRAMDANVKRYRVITESTELIIEINQSAFSSDSDKMYPYKVTIRYRATENPDFTNFEGCGSYILDYRLHDIWVLESLNGKGIAVPEGRELPHMEINRESNEFLGTTSCNQMRGKLFFEPELLRFTDVITTRKMCPGPLEAEFLKALQSTIHYTLGENRLRLSNPNGVEMVFKKVD